MQVYMYATPCALRSRQNHSPVDTVRMSGNAVASKALIEERLQGCLGLSATYSVFAEGCAAGAVRHGRVEVMMRAHSKRKH